jgi:hypothetical protein
MPSGHVTAAFAVATSLADEIKSPLASVLLYTAAAGTDFARINDNRHCYVGMGAAAGHLHREGRQRPLASLSTPPPRISGDAVRRRDLMAGADLGIPQDPACPNQNRRGAVCRRYLQGSHP